MPDQVYVLLSSVRNKLDFDEIVEVLDEVTRITDNNEDVVMEVGGNVCFCIHSENRSAVLIYSSHSNMRTITIIKARLADRICVKFNSLLIR